MRGSRLFAGIGAVVAAASAASQVSADDKTACVSAAAAGQTLRDEHKLIEAKEQFRSCAGRTCPAMVQSDCLGWLSEVDKSLPTLVVTARDAAGSDLIDVRVSVDGALRWTKLDGAAVPMNPGEHTFHFELGDGTQADRVVRVREGEKDQPVVVVLNRPPEAQPGDAQAHAPLPAPAPPAPGMNRWALAGWVLGGVGLGALAVGTVSGVAAASMKGAANCDANGMCDAGPLGSARGMAAISDVGFVAGGVLVAAGAALVLFSPRADHGAHEPTALLVPTAGPSSAGLVLRGAF